MICGWFLWRARVPIASQPVQSLAVLPLANLSGDATQEYFADGMTDALITELAQPPSLHQRAYQFSKAVVLT
jgi:TolB-like protein